MGHEDYVSRISDSMANAIRIALVASLVLEALEAGIPATRVILPIGGNGFVQTAIFLIGAVAFYECRNCFRRKTEVEDKNSPPAA